jgi:hypothetical protein
LAGARDAAERILSERLLEIGEANGQWRMAGHQSLDHAPRPTMGNSYSPAAALSPPMYKLSHQTDLDFLQQKQLQMLCFAEYSLYLHFESDITITIEGRIKHKVGKAKNQIYSFPIHTSCLMRLLGTSVQRIEVKNDENLLLEFSNGDLLVLEGQNGPYEAYQIRHKGGQIIV